MPVADVDLRWFVCVLRVWNRPDRIESKLYGVSSRTLAHAARAVVTID